MPAGEDMMGAGSYLASSQGPHRTRGESVLSESGHHENVFTNRDRYDTPPSHNRLDGAAARMQQQLVNTGQWRPPSNE